MRYSQRFLALLWLLSLGVYILAGVAIVPFHGDEATLIYMGRDFYYQFVQGDLELVAYSDPPISPTEQHLRLLNGTISKYLYGLAAYSLGYAIEDLNEQWDWGADWNYNAQNGHIPPQALLLRARLISALFLAGSCALVFGIGARLGGYKVAYWASAFYAFHPNLLLNGRRAMMEGAFLFFMLLALMAALHAARHRAWRAYALLGVACGLAMAAKHTAAFGIAGVFLALILANVWHHRAYPRRWARIAAQLALAVVIAGLSFYALNPSWWGDPIQRAQEVLSLRSDLLNGQVAFFGGYDGLGDQISGFYRQVFGGVPQYYESSAWADYISESIRLYDASPLSGVRWGIVGFVVALLCVWGLGAFTPSHRDTFIFFIWALAIIASALLLTPLEWGRYYLPALPVVALLSALGFGRIIEGISLRRPHREWYEITEHYPTL